jgi:hypothetical protein
MKTVKMIKSHVEADVHPDMVEQYLEHGWVLVDNKANANEEKPSKKKAK